MKQILVAPMLLLASMIGLSPASAEGPTLGVDANAAVAPPDVNADVISEAWWGKTVFVGSPLGFRGEVFHDVATETFSSCSTTASTPTSSPRERTQATSSYG